MSDILSNLTDSLQVTFNKDKKGLFGARTLILILGLFFGTAFYTYTIEFYNPDSNIWQYFRLTSKNYNFFSGSPGGLYIEIGKLIQSKTAENSTINVRNIESLGGSENVIKVLTTPRSFGLVQEETVKENDMIREQLNYVTPLYLERIHIIYRKDKFEQFSKNFPQLTSSSSDEVLKFFANSRIAAGPVGSGTRVIASYILSEINKQINDNPRVEVDKQEIINVSFSKGLSSIKANEEEIDVLFTIAGAPLKSVKEVLKDGRFGLVSILPSFVTNVNSAFNLNLRMADFNGIYKTEHDVATLGSYAYLIASKDVSETDILELLTTLDSNKDVIRNQFDIRLGSHFQLDEFDFLNLYKSKHQDTFMKDIKNIILFLVTFSFYSAVTILFLLWIVSSRKQAKYFKKIVNIISDNIPVNYTLNESESSLFQPIIYQNQINIINKIIEGISHLIKLNIEINQDYQTGGITDKHQNHLLHHIEDNIGKLRKNLAQRLNELLEQGGEIKEIELRAYYTAGYLLTEDYQYLLSKVNATKLLTEQSEQKES